MKRFVVKLLWYKSITIDQKFHLTTKNAHHFYQASSMKTRFSQDYTIIVKHIDLWITTCWLEIDCHLFIIQNKTGTKSQLAMTHGFGKAKHYKSYFFFFLKQI